MKLVQKILLKRISILLLVVTVAVTGYLWHRTEIKNTQLAKSNNSEFYLLDPARPLYTDENLVTNIEPLRKYLKSLPEREKDKADISIYFEVLTTGANISVNSDLTLWPASLAKLPLAMVVMKKIEEGSLKENTMLKFEKQDEDPTETSGMEQVIGREYPVSELLKNLLIYSSNVSYSMLKRQVTTYELNLIVNSIGLEQLFTEEGKVSAKEYSRLFRALYVSSYLKPENSQKLLNYMQDSKNAGFIIAGLPKDVPYAHKWGENSFYNVHSDSGIVYVSKRPYLITVMIQPKDSKFSTASQYSKDLMKEISEKAYNFITEDKID